MGLLQVNLSFFSQIYASIIQVQFSNIAHVNLTDILIFSCVVILNTVYLQYSK